MENGRGVYGEWACGCMVSGPGGVWSVDVGVYGEVAGGCMGEGACGSLESGRAGVWRVGEGMYGVWV